MREMENRRLFAWMAACLLLITVVTAVKNWLAPPIALPTGTTASAPAAVAGHQAHRDQVAWAWPMPGAALIPGRILWPSFPEAVQKAFAEKAELHRRDREQTERKKLEEEWARTPEATLTLGHAKSKLEVVLSATTGNVKSITLNSHQGASFDFARPDPLQPRLVLVTDDDDGRLKTLPPAERVARQSYRVEVAGVPLRWHLQPGATAEQAEFSAEVPERNVRLVKTFQLRPDAYHIQLRLRVELLDRSQPGEVVYELTGPHGIHVEGTAWKQTAFRQAVVGVVAPTDVRRLMRHVDDPAALDPNRNPKFVGAARVFHDPKDDQILQYAGVMSQFFSALVVVPRAPDEIPARCIEKYIPSYAGDDFHFAPPQAHLQGKVAVRLISTPVKLAAGTEPVTQPYELFAGPNKVLLLKYEQGVDPSLPDYYADVVHLRSLTEAPFYRWTEAIGWTAIVNFCTNLMHRLLEWLHTVLFSYGLAIVAMTVIVRLIMFPISRKQAMISIEMSRRMAALKPELDKINEKYKNDAQLRGMAQMELFRKHNVNPLQGCTGCLVMLLQMPVFMGLYYALNESTHLRLEGFLWMSNLAAPDMLLHWGNWPIIGSLARWLRLGEYFHLLPIISIAVMYWHQQKMMPPALDEQQAMQQKMMNYMMIFMGYLFYWVPSGLCLYFIISSVWGMLERRYLPKFQAATSSPASAGPGTSPPASSDSKSSRETKNPKDSRKKGPANKPEAGPSMSKKVADLWQKLLKEAEKRR
jgi:YidC/Oxa1 family membrane protein insertase